MNRSKEAQERVTALVTKKAEQMIRFEIEDGTTLRIHGVTSQFIKLEGIAKLRDFIARNFPQH